jgi:hypothetical protein
MSEAATERRNRVIERVLNGPGRSSPAARRAAFGNQDVDARGRALVDKVARHAWKVTRDDVEAAKAAGVSEDEIFELTVCAALGQAARQLEAGLAALNEATRAAGRAEAKR